MIKGISDDTLELVSKASDLYKAIVLDEIETEFHMTPDYVSEMN